MSRIKSDASATELTTAFSSDEFFMSHVSGIKLTNSKTNDDGTGNNPMFVVEFEIDEGPYKGRRIGNLERNIGHILMIGGKTKEGKDMPIRALLEFIDALKLPWTATPNGKLVSRPFKRVNQGGSMIFVDPDTNQRIANIEYDPGEAPNFSLWVGKRCKVRYGVRKFNDRDYNEVVALAPL